MVHIHSFWLSEWSNCWCWCLWWNVCSVLWISLVHIVHPVVGSIHNGNSIPSSTNILSIYTVDKTQCFS